MVWYNLLDDVVAENQAYYTELIDAAKVTQPEYIVSKEDINAIKKQTKDTFTNISASLGFLVDAGRTMLEPAKAYQWALDKAILEIQSGAVSYNTAIRNAVRELADSGIRVVNYESGHRDHADVAARRAIMTGVAQLNGNYTDEAADDLQTDLVEVSAHAGARNIDGKNAWDNHEKWQGQIYRWSVKPRTSKGDYPDYVKSCGYGDVTGIYGANCRHHASVFVEGIMERTYSDEDLEKLKGENRKFTYEGREYDGYTATQKQREIERTIRKVKRRMIADEAAGLTDEAQADNIRRRRLNEEYRAFSKAANLPTQLERLEVYDRNTIGKTTAKLNTTAKVTYSDITEKWLSEATPNSHTVQDLTEYTAGGITYKVDGHNVKLDYSAHEKEIAELLEREVGGELYMVPRVNNPQGIHTPDYLFRGEKYDLKTLSEKATANTIFNRVKKAEMQAQKFIIDISTAELDDNAVNSQIEKLFSRKDTAWVEEVLIIRDGKLIKAAKRA